MIVSRPAGLDYRSTVRAGRCHPTDNRKRGTAVTTPVTTLDQRFSHPDAAPTEWEQTSRALAEAELFWVTTVRADGLDTSRHWSPCGPTTPFTSAPALTSRRPSTFAATGT